MTSWAFRSQYERCLSFDENRKLLPHDNNERTIWRHVQAKMVHGTYPVTDCILSTDLIIQRKDIALTSKWQWLSSKQFDAHEKNSPMRTLKAVMQLRNLPQYPFKRQETSLAAATEQPTALSSSAAILSIPRLSSVSVPPEYRKHFEHAVQSALPNCTASGLLDPTRMKSTGVVALFRNFHCGLLKRPSNILDPKKIDLEPSAVYIEQIFNKSQAFGTKDHVKVDVPKLQSTGNSNDDQGSGENSSETDNSHSARKLSSTIKARRELGSNCDDRRLSSIAASKITAQQLYWSLTREFGDMEIGIDDYSDESDADEDTYNEICAPVSGAPARIVLSSPKMQVAFLAEEPSESVRHEATRQSRLRKTAASPLESFQDHKSFRSIGSASVSRSVGYTSHSSSRKQKVNTLNIANGGSDCFKRSLPGAEYELQKSMPSLNGILCPYYVYKPEKFCDGHFTPCTTAQMTIAALRKHLETVHYRFDMCFKCLQPFSLRKSLDEHLESGSCKKVVDQEIEDEMWLFWVSPRFCRLQGLAVTKSDERSVEDDWRSIWHALFGSVPVPSHFLERNTAQPKRESDDHSSSPHARRDKVTAQSVYEQFWQWIIDNRYDLARFGPNHETQIEDSVCKSNVLDVDPYVSVMLAESAIGHWSGNHTNSVCGEVWEEGCQQENSLATFPDSITLNNSTTTQRDRQAAIENELGNLVALYQLEAGAPPETSTNSQPTPRVALNTDDETKPTASSSGAFLYKDTAPSLFSAFSARSRLVGQFPHQISAV